MTPPWASRLFYEGGSEAARLWNSNGRPSTLLPLQNQFALGFSPNHPSDGKPPVPVGQSAVLDRVRRKLMQNKAQMQRRLRVEHHDRMGTSDAVVFAVAKWQLIANESRKLSPLPRRLSEQTMRLSQRLKPSPKARCKIARAFCSVNRLIGDGLNRRERILHAMIELTDQQGAAIFRRIYVP